MDARLGIRRPFRVILAALIVTALSIFGVRAAAAEEWTPQAKSTDIFLSPDELNLVANQTTARVNIVYRGDGQLTWTCEPADLVQVEQNPDFPNAVFVSATAAGKGALTFNATATENYEAATKTLPITVRWSMKTATLTLDPTSAPYTGKAPDVKATVTDQSGQPMPQDQWQLRWYATNPDEATLPPTALSAPPSQPGTYWVSAWAAAGSETYAGSTDAVQFTIEGDGPGPAPFDIVDLDGATRVGTAIETAFYGYKDTGAQGVIVATEGDFPDALSASPLAGALGYPILLSDATQLNAQVAEAIQTLNAQSIIVIGGEASISGQTYDELAALVGDEQITRLDGPNRYATQMAIYDYGAENNLFSGAPIIATGQTFPDALSISPYAAANCSPIFLANGSDDPFSTEAQDALLNDFEPGNAAIIVGGTSSVNAAAQNWLENEAGFSVERLDGPNRYATAAHIIDYELSQSMSLSAVGIASGEEFADALVAGPVLGARNSVLFPIDPQAGALNLTTLTQQAASIKQEASTLIYFGGTASIDEAVRSEISALLGA